MGEDHDGFGSRVKCLFMTDLPARYVLSLIIPLFLVPQTELRRLTDVYRQKLLAAASTASRLAPYICGAPPDIMEELLSLLAAGVGLAVPLESP